MSRQGMFVCWKSEATFWLKKKIRACLLIQKKVVFVSQIKVGPCRWACKMPDASPSSPRSCNALIHQNQSHFHELVIRFLAASGQIMYFFLRADISALVSEANATDWLVSRPGCFCYGAGWQQINSYFVGFCLIACEHRPKHLWGRDSWPSSSDDRERSFQRHQVLFKGGINAGAHKDVPVGVAGWPMGRSLSCVPARCHATPPASRMLCAQKNWKRGWWQAARRDWLATCARRYLLRPVRGAGRGLQSSSVRQEWGVRPGEQPLGGTQRGWHGLGASSGPSASPPPRAPPSTMSPKTSHHSLCWEKGIVPWRSSIDSGASSKMLISGHKLSSPCEAQGSCLQLRLTPLANELSMGCGHPSRLLLCCALKHEM